MEGEQIFNEEKMVGTKNPFFEGPKLSSPEEVKKQERKDPNLILEQMAGGEQKEEGDTNSIIEVPTQENNETIPDYLRRLQWTGNYLFHGSPFGAIAELEPRLAADLSGDPWKNDRAVFAVPDAALAVQRALLPDLRKIEGPRVIITGKNPQAPAEPYMEISRNVAVALGSGSLYVLPKTGFEVHPKGGQWKSKEPVKPIMELPVGPDDYERLGGKIVVRE